MQQKEKLYTLDLVSPCRVEESGKIIPQHSSILLISEAPSTSVFARWIELQASRHSVNREVQ